MSGGPEINLMETEGAEVYMSIRGVPRCMEKSNPLEPEMEKEGSKGNFGRPDIDPKSVVKERGMINVAGLEERDPVVKGFVRVDVKPVTTEKGKDGRINNTTGHFGSRPFWTGSKPSL